MGAGKTTVGKVVAELLHYTFLDTDQWIEANEGKAIHTIFEEEGEDYFREKETNLIASLKDKTNLVIAVGGGLPCFNENMSRIAQLGTVVYLKASTDELFHRLKNNVAKRPLLKNKTAEELKIYIESTLRLRAPFFEQADLIITTENKSVLKIAEIIKNKQLSIN